MSTRIYHVAGKIPGIDPRLVRAGNQAQALGHVAKHTLSVKVAAQDDLVYLTGAGVKVEDAGDPPLEPPLEPQPQIRRTHGG